MTPVAPGHADVLPSTGPYEGVPRGGESVPPLVLAIFDEIEGLRRLVSEFRTGLEAIEQRLSAMTALEERVAVLEAVGP